MARHDYAAGFPQGFSSPSDAAEQLARLPTAAERRAFLERISPSWHWWVIHEASREIAIAIADEAPGREARAMALAEVPEEWRAGVRDLALVFFRTRVIRAAYQAELAAAQQRKAA